MSGRVQKSQFKSPKVVTKLSDYLPQHGRCNILLFGQSGAGKSSIINTVYSTNDKLVRKAKVRKAKLAQCTVTYDRYIFNDQVSLFDTWGWSVTKESYNDTSFKSILRGIMKENHRMDADIFIGESSEDERIIDAVVFVVSSDVKNNPSVLVKMRRFYQIAKEQQIPVFFAVTKIDLWFSQDYKKNLLIAKDPQYAARQIQQSRNFQRLQTYIQQNIKDNRAVILPIINYDHQSVVTNDILDIVSQQFVSVLTRRIDVHYSNVQKRRQQPNAYLGVEYMFQNEDYRKLIFDEIDDPKIARVKFDDLKPDVAKSNFVIIDCFYNQLLLGRTKWRFFMLVTKNSKVKIMGLYTPDRDVYFETSVVPGNVTVEFLRRSFGENFAPKYAFFDREGRALEEYHETMVKFVKIGLIGGFIALKRQDRENWTRFHSMIINVVQGRKEEEEIKRRFERRIKRISESAEETVKKVSVEMKQMKDNVKKLLGQNL